MLTTESIVDVPSEPKEKAPLEEEKPIDVEVVDPSSLKKVFCDEELPCERKLYKINDMGANHNVEFNLPDGLVYVVSFKNGCAQIPQKVAEYIQKTFSRSRYAVQ